MNEELLAVVVDIGRMFMKSIPISLALAAVFTVLTQFWACNPGRPWWRKRDLVTDLCYWFFIPVVTRYFRIGLLVLGAAVFCSHHHRRRPDRLLRERPRPARARCRSGCR